MLARRGILEYLIVKGRLWVAPMVERAGPVPVFPYINQRAFNGKGFAMIKKPTYVEQQLSDAEALLFAAVNIPTTENTRQFTIKYIELWWEGVSAEQCAIERHKGAGYNIYLDFYSDHEADILKLLRPLAHVEISTCVILYEKIQNNIFRGLAAGVVQISLKGLPDDAYSIHEYIAAEAIADLYFKDEEFLAQIGLIEPVQAEVTGPQPVAENEYTWKEFYTKVMGATDYTKKNRAFQKRLKTSKYWLKDVSPVGTGDRITRIKCKPSFITTYQSYTIQT